ncbi:hypothetical protein K6V98_03630 [Collinsella sp. AGMB00827]|uniref:Uncharacterized protein n=1 Tax=Collinsella ureilytica TaxID=2869515 RepID=A0ABS7MJI5_9ACTN|nr:hypothetical protein [Collinsella urealyticum]MBY4797447.1 hypothetical protein [Collinsella urealyticum]
MAVSDAQRRATEKYRREKTRAAHTVFYPADMDIWEWYSAQENKQAYIRGLIREDMNRQASANSGSSDAPAHS